MQSRSRRFFSRLILVYAHAGYLVIFTETGKQLLPRPQGE